MEKSDVTEFFLKYFEKNRINEVWISEEFLRLCAVLQIQPEEIMLIIKLAKK